MAETGAIARFAGRFFREGFRPRYELRELLYQRYAVGRPKRCSPTSPRAGSGAKPSATPP